MDVDPLKNVESKLKINRKYNEHPGPDHQQRGGQSANHIKTAPLPMRQAEFAHYFAGKDRDEEGLTKAGRKGQQEPRRQEFQVVTDEVERAHIDRYSAGARPPIGRVNKVLKNLRSRFVSEDYKIPRMRGPTKRSG